MVVVHDGDDEGSGESPGYDSGLCAEDEGDDEEERKDGDGL